MSVESVSIPYAHLDTLNLKGKNVISSVAHDLFPDTELKLVEDDTSPILSSRAIADYFNSDAIVRSQMKRLFGMLPTFSDDELFLDIETHNAEKVYDMPITEFFRLGQYAWGEGEVVLTTDLSEIIEQIIRARIVYAHNGHSFDFSALLGNDALDLAMMGVLFDTYTHAEINFPCPIEYTHSNGTTYKNNSTPGTFRRWFGLDNLAYQFGFPGKAADLESLARKYNPEGTAKADLDYGLIPVDDPEFREYATQDIPALRELTRSMFGALPVSDYSLRAQKMAAINAQMMRNGIRVDVDLAKERVQEAEDTKNKLLGKLVTEYGFPTEGKKPWVSKAGKTAIFAILADNGITPQSHPEWTKTATGSPSLSGETLIALTEGTPVEELGQSLAQLGGLRPLAEQVLTYTRADGRVHPDIDGLQRSGRNSVTQPGLTTFGKVSPDKALMLPDEGFDMYSVDLSNADARAVAFMSGDKNRAKWFEPGADSHEIVGRLMWGDAEYDSDPAKHRNMAKPLNHSGAYGAAPRKLAMLAKVPLETAELYTNVIRHNYPDVVRWQDRVRAEGESGSVTNYWNRIMPVQTARTVDGKTYRSRSYTQSPALLGQSSTNEVLYDGMIKLYYKNREMMNYLLFPVHDEIILQIPKEGGEGMMQDLLDCTEQTINGITFSLAHGAPGANWKEATH